MKGITIKLSDETLARLRREAKASGRSVAALVRDRLEHTGTASQSALDLMGDLAGSLEGSGRPATNARKKFRRA